MNDFEVQRRAANANIRALKESTPFVFQQWQTLQQAKQRLKEARDAVKVAQYEWDRLGVDNPNLINGAKK